MKYLGVLLTLVLAYNYHTLQRQKYTPEALAKSSLLRAMKAVSDKPTPDARRVLYEELLQEPLWFDFGDLSGQMTFGGDRSISQEISSGMTSCGSTLYAFTDEEALRRWKTNANPSVRPFKKMLNGMIRDGSGIACAQINPDGPGTAVLSNGEIKALADGDVEGALEASRP